MKYPTKPPLPTTLDLYDELIAVTPDSLHYLTYDLFAANSFWELGMQKAKAKQISADTWQISLEVEARKVIVDSIGREVAAQMNDWIEIGIYGLPTENAQSGKVLYSEKHLLRSGRQIIVFDVLQKPYRAGIDPNHLLIDLDMENNMQTIKF